MRITERIQRSFAEADVSTDQGTIRNIAILTLESSNRSASGKPRRYDEEAVKRAVLEGKYNGVQVYADHVDPARENEPRSVKELIGKVIEVRWVEAEKKVRGDLRLLTSDDQARKVLEMAADPDLSSMVGMSHDADAEAKESPTEELITQIHEVYSVDVVTRPATTGGLRESSRRQRSREAKMIGIGERCMVKAADGSSVKGVVTRGAMVEVTMDGAEMPQVVPVELVMLDEEPEAEPQTEPTEQDEEPQMDDEKKPPDETTQEARKVRAPAPDLEKEALRKRVALLETRDHVREATKGLPEGLQAKVNKKFAGKAATPDEVTEYVTDLREAMSIGRATEADDYHFAIDINPESPPVDLIQLRESINGVFGPMTRGGN